MRARIVTTEFGIPRATVILTDNYGKSHSHIVYLRDWTSPDGEVYCLLAECPQIPDLEARYAVNMALLEFQEYQSPYENTGHAD